MIRFLACRHRLTRVEAEADQFSFPVLGFAQCRCSADTVWTREPGLQVLPERVHFSLPYPRAAGARTVPSQTCLPISLTGRSAIVLLLTATATTTLLTVSLQNTWRAANWSLGTVLPTPSFRAATLPDSCLRCLQSCKTTLCYVRGCGLAWLQQLGSLALSDVAGQICLAD